MEYLTFRITSSLLTGVILSQAGSFIQLSTRNILASPATLGFDGFSILWILITHSCLIYFQSEPSLAWVLLSGVVPFVFLGIWFTYFLNKFKKMEKLIFIGLVFSLMIGAIFSLWHFLFLAFNLPFPVELWFGHFRFANLQTVQILLVFEFALVLAWFFQRKKIFFFSLGPSVYLNQGLEIKNLYLFIFISISLGIFTITTLFGSFSFLGLIFPIISRKLWFKKYDLDGEFILGAFLNGFVLMLVDLICYSFPLFGAEIPVGLIASAVGALSLIIILMKMDNRFEILANREK